jgi:apolipoprotein D and lipocalin family protein
MKVNYPIRFSFFLIFSVLYLLVQSGCKTIQPGNMDYSTVQQLDLERYMGKWFEIARYDNRFERGLVGVTATYELRPDGKINVINAGYKNSFGGKYKTATGKGKQPDPNEPGKLKVAFFLFFYADYYIFELGDDYEWALVGTSSDKYLWILSRTSSLSQETTNLILAKARQRGFDTSRLIWVEHRE